MTPPDPTVADMIAWCEQAAEAADKIARAWEASKDFREDAANWFEDAVMLRAVAARLRQTEEGR